MDAPGLGRRADRPLAYVGFGTVPMYRDAPGLDALLDALLAAGTDVLCTGPRHPAARDRIRVERFVSLPACALVVRHGGVGTTLAALTHGLPVVLLPRGARSRLRMTRACAARGVAAVVDGTDPTAAIRTALTGEHARHAAELARELAAAPEPAQVVETLERGLG